MSLFFFYAYTLRDGKVIHPSIFIHPNTDHDYHGISVVLVISTKLLGTEFLTNNVKCDKKSVLKKVSNLLVKSQKVQTNL